MTYLVSGLSPEEISDLRQRWPGSVHDHDDGSCVIETAGAQELQRLVDHLSARGFAKLFVDQA